MIVSGKLESCGPMRPLIGHLVVEELHIGGTVIKKLRVPKKLAKDLVVGHDMSLFIQRFLGTGVLLGVSEDYGTHTIGLKPILVAAFIASVMTVYFCLLAITELWAYLAGVPAAFLTFWLASLFVSLLHFGH